MTSKAYKLSLVVAVGILAAALIGGFAFAAGGGSAELPEYVGSRACLGCHTDSYSHWQETGHAHMVSPVFKNSDLPGDPATAPPELKAELNKAGYVVAGQRFIGKNENGEWVYLNVRWNGSAYVPYKGGSSWEKGCAGCHSTGWDKQTAHFAEPGIGCEACHGPGRDHVVSHGDRSKIAIDTSSQTCGSCHNGGAMPDGTRWPEGFKPGMMVEETGFKVKPVDPNAPPPDPALHLRQFALVAASGHDNGMKSLLSNSHAQARCATCHSATAFAASLKGETVTDWKSLTDGVSCVACHDPHNDKNPGQLRLPAEQLCITCHNGHLEEGHEAKPGSTIHHPMKEMFEGFGGIGAGKAIPSIHAEVTCVECHMNGTEGGHMFKVLEPKDTVGTKRTDACVQCHNDLPEVRQAYLDMWRNTTDAKVASLRAMLKQADAKLAAFPNPELKAKRDIAYTNITYVEADGSHGVHNFDYAMKLLKIAEDNLKAVLGK